MILGLTIIIFLLNPVLGLYFSAYLIGGFPGLVGITLMLFVTSGIAELVGLE